MKKIFLLSALLVPAMLLGSTTFAQTYDPLVSIPAVTTNYCGVINTDLQVSSRGEQVTALQSFLQRGYLNAEPTGYFGPQTFAAVQKYQAVNGIKPASGFVGPLTREKINSQSCAANTTSAPSTQSQDRAALLAQIEVLMKTIAQLQAQLEAQKEATSQQQTKPAEKKKNAVIETPSEKAIDDLLDSDVFFSKSYFSFTYVIGDAVNENFYQRSIITVGAKGETDIEISVDDKPSWLEIDFAKEVTISPYAPTNITADVNPVSLKAGTYKSEVKIEGDFVGSPMIIPVTLSVYNSASEQVKSVDITYPKEGDIWIMGDQEKIRWVTEGIPNNGTGQIELMDSSHVKTQVAQIDNSGIYYRTVGSYVAAGPAIRPGQYHVIVTMNRGGVVGDMVGPITIMSAATEAKVIKVSHLDTGNISGGYEIYDLILSGGTTESPVKQWNLDFICPSNVTDVAAKVSDDICGGDTYSIGNNERDIKIPLYVLRTNSNKSDLKIHITAIGADGSKMDETDYVLPI